MWRGPAFGEFADTFAGPVATRLEELHIAALEDRTALLLRRGTLDEAVARAGDLASTHPLRERPVTILMRALHAAGRTALDVYQRHHRYVADKLGIDPSPQVRELQAAILQNDVAPVPATHARPPTADTPPAGTAGLPGRPSKLLGRATELEDLLRALARHRLVTLVGTGRWREPRIHHG